MTNEATEFQQGIYSPPDPLPNPTDLGMGRYLHFMILNMTDETCVKQWNQVINWFKTKGAPIANETFFTALTGSLGGSPYAPTAVLLSDAAGKTIMFDATMCYNFPDSHLQQLEAFFGFGNPNQIDGWPGFDVINDAESDPVGPPMPNKNTPGWTREFPRYNSINANYNPARHVPGYIFNRVNGEQYEMNELPGAPRPGGPFAGFTTLPAWQRLR